MQKKYLLSGLVGLGLILLVSGCGKVTINNLTSQQKTKVENQLSTTMVVASAASSEEQYMFKFMNEYIPSVDKHKNNWQAISGLDVKIVGNMDSLAMQLDKTQKKAVFSKEQKVIYGIGMDIATLMGDNNKFNTDESDTKKLMADMTKAIKDDGKLLGDVAEARNLFNQVSG